jgi:hypothetical protein
MPPSNSESCSASAASSSSATAVVLTTRVSSAPSTQLQTGIRSSLAIGASASTPRALRSRTQVQLF